MKTIILVMAAGVATLAVMPAMSDEPTVFELRQPGTGLRCLVSVSAEGPVSAEPRCTEIAPVFDGPAAMDADSERIAFRRNDGSALLEFISAEGDVFESSDAGAPPILLSVAR